ncbi:vitamin K-dependent protein C [Trichonephila inaurata madagascariensis]|uniref:Vitamin K-dependent protein C n=1 Tax=Trichonephila inaurata madagascariensis TaxID=2747483 RepID=A0A8X6XS33_9ARAC|nr:vitamin K-dependent protein C [Trichonephila inaurata madagascariensis]
MLRPIIAGGTKVKRFDKYPFEAAIIEADSETIYCGGVIISSKFILTAAHCLTNDLIVKSRAKCQTWNMPKECFRAPKTMRIGYINHPTQEIMHKKRVLRTIPHPYYNAVKITNDIGLIELVNPIVCLDLPRPICLPTRNFSKLGNELIIAGWGYSEEEALNGQTVLTEGKVIQVPPTDCGYLMIPTERILCARGMKSRQASCQGDSGSGIFALRDFNYYVLGVTSIGPIECGFEHPDAYTDVYAYMDWIKSIVKDIPTI